LTEKDILEQVSVSWCRRHRPESESTDWGQSLLAYGLLKSYLITGNAEVKEYLRRWFMFHLAEGVQVHYFCGSWSFALLYPEIVEVFPEAKMQLDDIAHRIYDTITKKALRNGDGVILHNIDLPNIYIDTVYYSAVLLAKLGTYLDLPWEKDAFHQIEAHLTILKDGEKPFYIHCQENLTGKRSEGSWARGNGWVMMAYAEILSLLKSKSEKYDKMVEDFSALSEAILQKQSRVFGLWSTILDDETSYIETSASAMFLFSLARGRKLGVLGGEFINAIGTAAKKLEHYVDENSKFIGVSEGTWPGTIAYYKSLSQGEWWWGTGAYLLALSELS
jgi:unsaturated rhamnogalacturonyl hydrolase